MEKEVPELITVEAEGQPPLGGHYCPRCLPLVSFAYHQSQCGRGDAQLDHCHVFHNHQFDSSWSFARPGDGLVAGAYHCAFFQIGISFGQHCQ